MTELLVFISQFSLVFLLGLQSQFVRDGHYIGAAIVSLALGIAGFYVTMQIAIIKEMFTSIWWVYILAGPVAINSSIFVHKRYLKK